MTLDGTNTYVVAAGDGAFVIDPGPADQAHAAAVLAAADARGGIEGVLLTHSHADHSAGVSLLGEAPLRWGDVGHADESSGESGAARPDEGWPRPPDRVGPFEVIPTPGHAVDHVCFARDGVLFSGDLILGRGSSFVPPDGGSLAAYLESLRTILDRDDDLLCPGHGPYVTNPRGEGLGVPGASPRPRAKAARRSRRRRAIPGAAAGPGLGRRRAGSPAGGGAGDGGAPGEARRRGPTARRPRGGRSLDFRHCAVGADQALRVGRRGRRRARRRTDRRAVVGSVSPAVAPDVG